MAVILLVAIYTDNSTWTSQYVFYYNHHTLGSDCKKCYQIVQKAKQKKFTWGVCNMFSKNEQDAMDHGCNTMQ